MLLSFFTYASISYDLVHRNLGLSRGWNDAMLSAIELLALRSGHAYRAVHLHHHATFPDAEDLEGAAARMSLPRALWDGLTLQYRIIAWALRQPGRHRPWVWAESTAAGLLVVMSLAAVPWTIIPAAYVGMMIAGSWVYPFMTAYLPHDAMGQDVLSQTRRFRGMVASWAAFEHLYHLEHHLYPQVPHHRWARLAKRLDPTLDRLGVPVIRLWK